MFQTITFYHSLFRWLVLISLVFAIYRAFRGYYFKKPFLKADNSIRHWTATIAHVQLVIGVLIYSQSPIIKYFWLNRKEALNSVEITFFASIHALMMLASIVLITIGSSLAKRKENDPDKFKTILIWYTIALLLIIIAIPWPFSPLANRPYFR